MWQEGLAGRGVRLENQAARESGSQDRLTRARGDAVLAFRPELLQSVADQGLRWKSGRCIQNSA